MTSEIPKAALYYFPGSIYASAGPLDHYLLDYDRTLNPEYSSSYLVSLA
jgi:hypothetical protein